MSNIAGKYDVIVVGGSAAGVTAAITARKHYKGKSILLIKKEKLVPIPCGIPYTFGIVESPVKNLIPVETLLAANGIDGLTDEVIKIDRAEHSVYTKEGRRLEYIKLIIATGSNPIIPPIPGHEKNNVFCIKKDVDYLQRVIEKLSSAKDLCIIGCGFIGVEIAEECRRRNPDMNISIVEMLSHCLQLVYDEEFCLVAEKTLKEEKVNLLLDEKAVRINGEDKVESIELGSGKMLRADMIIMGIGAVANVKLAEEAGLETGPTKAIQVNRYMQTSDDDIFACGDCAEKVSFFDGKPSNMKLASIATMEARMAGANIFSIRRVNMGVIGVYSTVIGGSAFAAAGLTKSQAVAKGYNIVSGEAESVNRHPGCMPGAANLKVRLIFEAGSGVILGGQVTGATSGGELINAVSACINKRMTADDIATFQTGTHPALTASPISYQLVNAAENAISSAF